MYNFLYYFFIFMIYSIAGWIMETVICSITQRKIVNRGFLIGPYCPIYGWGSLIITFTLSDYYNDPFVLFGMSTIICSILEFFTSWIMEKFFNARWWDYSHDRFNIEGRICLKNSLLFGLGGFLIIVLFNPIINKVLTYIPSSIIMISSSILFILYIIDNICSFVVIRKMRLIVTKVRSDISDEIGRRVKEIIFNQSIFSRRLLIAYPDIKIPNIKIKRLKRKKKKPHN